MLASAFSLPLFGLEDDQPPPDLLQKIAVRASETWKARDNYTYRQSLTLQEIDHRDLVVGQYHEVREVTFSPNGGRYEKTVGTPQNTLTRIKLTPEDFDDIRSIEPFFLTTGTAWLYKLEYKGDEPMDGIPCWVVHIAPKQILSGKRYYDGLLWVKKTDYSVVRSEGQAVPQIETTTEQNLFPHFTTIWGNVDGWMFPVQTFADDTLFFKDWPQRIRITIKYTNYKKFGVETQLTFQGEAPPQQPDKNAPPAPGAAPVTPPPPPQ